MTMIGVPPDTNTVGNDLLRPVARMRGALILGIVVSFDAEDVSISIRFVYNYSSDASHHSMDTDTPGVVCAAVVALSTGSCPASPALSGAM